ncbi:PREDICTED: uncharacterized protein LOC105143432 [Acromyrmex echinatior]|uniref:uncharacterized protein LOC105143432 n=1 Tax=Acromyrmex echinatior TaxID=103372 RepID=UPI0005810550|nr:PREDICTED: uncharacterized protein LOC105143432 [Acromyrmex echinatior]
MKIYIVLFLVAKTALKQHRNKGTSLMWRSPRMRRKSNSPYDAARLVGRQSADFTEFYERRSASSSALFIVAWKRENQFSHGRYSALSVLVVCLVCTCQRCALCVRVIARRNMSRNVLHAPCSIRVT